MDVLVAGMSFDALQVGVRVLWEIKTHQFDTYPLIHTLTSSGGGRLRRSWSK
jgi:hypothetical protein